VTTAAKEGPRTLIEYLQVTTQFLAAKGITGARLDAELLLAEVLGMTRTQLYTNFEQPLGAGEVTRYRELVRRRAAREPVAYITGRREFWSLDFEVDRRVLIPRPETELVVEVTVEAMKAGGRSSRDAFRIADVGTGSGAIAIAIANELPGACMVGTDRSESALEVAPRNARRHVLEERIELRAGDGCAALAGLAAFDAIVSNPPYILSEELRGLEPEVRDWEPKGALDGGSDGMSVTRPLIEQAIELLAPGGLLVMEVGTQAAQVLECASAHGYDRVSLRRDLAGIPRVVSARRPD